MDSFFIRNYNRVIGKFGESHFRQWSLRYFLIIRKYSNKSGKEQKEKQKAGRKAGNGKKSKKQEEKQKAEREAGSGKRSKKQEEKQETGRAEKQRVRKKRGK